MTLDQIDGFLTAVECGNFVSAAASLFITQSTLGYRISTLEKELGYQLFLRHRGQRRVELTVAGAKFVSVATQIRALCAEALSFGSAEGSEVVRVAMIYSLQAALAAPMISKLADHGFDAVLTATNTRDAVEMTENGEVDFAIVGDRVAADRVVCMAEPLCEERMCVACSLDSPFGDAVSIEELDYHNEVYMTGSLTFEHWHRRVFGESFSPLMAVSGMLPVYEMLAPFPERWAVISQTLASYYQDKGMLKKCDLGDMAPSRQIRLVSRRPIKVECHDILLAEVRAIMSEMDGMTLAG